jgi:hypothetical protein
MNGRVYFTGNDPHYGGWGFCPEPGKAKPKYGGPPLAAYVMKTGRIESHGVPLPGHLGVFEMVGDTERNTLYLRPGFSRGHYGPLEWFALSFDAEGRMIGEPRPVPFPQPLPGTIIVGTNGTLYGAMPDGELYAQYHKGGGEKSGVRPRCHVYRCDPDLKGAEKVATVDGVWEIEWFLFQDRQPRALGFSGGRFSAEQGFFRIDLTSGAIEKLAPWPKSLAGAERLLLRNGKVWVSLFQNGKADGKDLRTRTAGIYSIDPTSGDALYYGVLKDDKGRRPKDLNYFQFLPDGRFFAVGTVHCIPGDKNYMPRDRSQEPFGLDCAAFIVDKLPPGKPF